MGVRMNSITIGDYTYEDIGGLEVKITDKTVCGQYPDGPGYGPDSPWIIWSTDFNYMLPLIKRIIELEREIEDARYEAMEEY